MSNEKSSDKPTLTVADVVHVSRCLSFFPVRERVVPKFPSGSPVREALENLGRAQEDVLRELNAAYPEIYQHTRELQDKEREFFSSELPAEQFKRTS